MKGTMLTVYVIRGCINGHWRYWGTGNEWNATPYFAEQYWTEKDAEEKLNFFQQANNWGGFFKVEKLLLFR